jgi:UDP-2,3-diacylglucosamine hydrolase
MTVAFISDLHLDPSRPESTEWFRSFMNTSPDYLNQVYILGDLFEFWIGDDGRDALGHEDVEGIIRTAVDSGVEVYFIHGNRDFLVGSSFETRTGCEILPDPTLITLGPDRVLLTHGDALCTDDTEHQEARKVMLTSKWKFAFLDKSIDDRLNSALSLRSKSRISKQSKSMEIMDVNQSQVEKVMRDHGVFKMIHGHTHKPGVHEFMLDNVVARRYVLGDWYSRKSVLYYDHDGYALRK